MSAELLAAEGITLWRGDSLILDDITIRVNSGEAVQLQGANGSGKTTLLRILCGLAEAEEGHISWCGKPLHKIRDDFYARLLYLGHRAGIKGELTPLENLAIFQQLGVSSGVSASEALEQVSLSDKAHIACAKLSAGQQRRVALARLVLQRADLWVLDEPLTALDASGLAWLGGIIKQQVVRGGSVLLTTHQSLEIDGVSVRTQVLAGS